MYPARPSADGESKGADGSEGAEEWDSWGRPPNGFIDLGCVSLGLVVDSSRVQALNRVLGEWSFGSYPHLRGKSTATQPPTLKRPKVVESSYLVPSRG